MVKALEGYAMQEPEDLTASHRIHIHLFSAPHEVLTETTAMSWACAPSAPA